MGEVPGNNTNYVHVAVSVSGISHNYHNSNRICIVHNLIRGLSGFEYLQSKYTYLYVVVKVFTPPVARVVEEFLNLRTCMYLYGRLKTWHFPF